MKKHRKKIGIGLVLAVSLLLVGCSFINTTKEGMEAADMEMAGSETAIYYEDYTAEKFAALHGSEKFMLFFHADWCPLCRALEARVKKNPEALNGHTLLEANYDRETELKKEYGVVAQTTVILFNEDGSVGLKKVNPRLSQIEEFFQ